MNFPVLLRESSTSMTNIEISQILRKMREDAGISQKQMAKIIGASLRTTLNIENQPSNGFYVKYLMAWVSYFGMALLLESDDNLDKYEVSSMSDVNEAFANIRKNRGLSKYAVAHLFDTTITMISNSEKANFSTTYFLQFLDNMEFTITFVNKTN